MQTLMRPQSPDLHVQNRESLPSRKKRRFSPVMLSGTIITLLLVLSAGAFVLLQQKSNSFAADDEVNCTLIVPPQPLSAQGLATPYQLTATDDGNCREANKLQAAFVQGAIFDPATNQISVYNPLVVDKGKKPAIAPIVPKLPQGATVAIWFGFNGTNLTLKSNDNSLKDGKCVGGLKKSLFGQFAYCNAPAFFEAANKAIQAGKLVPPPLGTGKDGLTCPTVRDFGVVDQDQSDNVTTAYLIDRKGRTAQMNAANEAQLSTSKNAKMLVNGSDNRLLSVALDGALGCTSWMAPDLANPGHMATALPLNELQAAAHQTKPVATVPAGDPMVKVDDDQNIRKLNLYRVGVNQASVDDLDNASTKLYCKNLLAIGPMRILVDAKLTRGQPSPDPAAAKDLFTFLAQRFNTSFGENGINCQELLDTKSPIKVKNNDDDVAVSATVFGLQSIDTSNCVSNGKLVQNCQGKTQIDDQTCSFKLNAGDNQADLNCPNDHHDNNGQNDDNGNKHQQSDGKSNQDQDKQERHHQKLNMDQMDKNEDDNNN